MKGRGVEGVKELVSRIIRLVRFRKPSIGKAEKKMRGPENLMVRGLCEMQLEGGGKRGAVVVGQKKKSGGRAPAFSSSW